MTSQLKSMIRCRETHDLMSYYRTSFVEEQNVIKDVYDGQAYKLIVKPITKEGHNYSVTMNWDWCQQIQKQ